MKRFILSLLAMIVVASVAHGQAITFGEKVIPFRSTGATGAFNYNALGANGTILYSYQDTSWTSRGGAAWGTTVLSQTDTTVWFSTADLQDWASSMMTRAGVLNAADTLLVFQMRFVPDEANAGNGLTAAADTIYATLQGTNDGGQNVTSATWNQVANPSTGNGFTRAFYGQLNTSNPSAIGLSTLLGFKQVRFIISSDINGRYVCSVKYPKLAK